MQVLNIPFMSNPWPRNRNTNFFKSEDPSRKMDPSPKFYGLPNKIPLIHARNV